MFKFWKYGNIYLQLYTHARCYVCNNCTNTSPKKLFPQRGNTDNIMYTCYRYTYVTKVTISSFSIYMEIATHKKQDPLRIVCDLFLVVFEVYLTRSIHVWSTHTFERNVEVHFMRFIHVRKWMKNILLFIYIRQQGLL